MGGWGGKNALPPKIYTAASAGNRHGQPASAGATMTSTSQSLASACWLSKSRLKRTEPAGGRQWQQQSKCRQGGSERTDMHDCMVLAATPDTQVPRGAASQPVLLLRNPRCPPVRWPGHQQAHTPACRPGPASTGAPLNNAGSCGTTDMPPRSSSRASSNTERPSMSMSPAGRRWHGTAPGDPQAEGRQLWTTNLCRPRPKRRLRHWGEQGRQRCCPLHPCLLPAL